MFGSLDCTHWTWKNCPVAWQGHYQDRKGLRSIVMEAVSTQDLWIWHAFIGIPGSNNDINVLDRSPLLPEWFKGPAKEAEYQINGVNYQGSYLLADGIYPDSTLFVKTFSNPQSAKLKHFAKQQEAVRKDVERCFGVLKSRFSILNGAGRLWDIEVMKNIWTSAVIMHNMILEDERKDERIECGADIENGGDDADEDGTDREDGTMMKTKMEQIEKMTTMMKRTKSRRSELGESRSLTQPVSRNYVRTWLITYGIGKAMLSIKIVLKLRNCTEFIDHCRLWGLRVGT